MARGKIPEINEAQRALLISAQKRILRPKHLKRVQAVLARSEGIKVAQIAQVLRVDRTQISRWVRVYHNKGIEGLLQDGSRPGRIKPVSSTLEEKVCRLTVQEKPKNATHWTTRTMAKRVGLSHNKVSEIWRKYGRCAILRRPFMHTSGNATKIQSPFGGQKNLQKSAQRLRRFLDYRRLEHI